MNHCMLSNRNVSKVGFLRITAGLRKIQMKTMSGDVPRINWGSSEVGLSREEAEQECDVT